MEWSRLLWGRGVKTGMDANRCWQFWWPLVLAPDWERGFPERFLSTTAANLSKREMFKDSKLS